MAGRTGLNKSLKRVGVWVALVAALLMAGCGGAATLALINDDCEDDMAATRRDLGEPDRIERISGSDTDIVIFVYRSIGLIRTFEWGPYMDCKGEDKTFTPVPPGAEPTAVPSTTPMPGTT